MSGKHLSELLPDLAEQISRADHCDAVSCLGQADLRSVVASSLSFTPWWMLVLMKIRGVVAAILGLQHPTTEEPLTLTAQDIPQTPSKTVGFFKVHRAKENTYWVASAGDRHLEALICFVAEATVESNIRRFYVATVVEYRHWTGPAYFNLIRPFHYIVIHAMVKQVCRDLDMTGIKVHWTI